MKRLNTAVERELRADMTDEEVLEARKNPPPTSELFGLWGESYWTWGQWDDALTALKWPAADVEYLTSWRDAMRRKIEEIEQLKRIYKGNAEILKLACAVGDMAGAIRDGFQERIDKIHAKNWAPYERNVKELDESTPFRRSCSRKVTSVIGEYDELRADLVCRDKCASTKHLHRVGQRVFSSVEEYRQNKAGAVCPRCGGKAFYTSFNVRSKWSEKVAGRHYTKGINHAHDEHARQARREGHRGWPHHRQGGV